MSNLQSRNLSFQILGVQTSFRKEVLLVKSPQITCSPCILSSKLGKQQFLSNCHVMFKSVRSKCAKSSLKSNYHYLICITSNYMMTGWYVACQNFVENWFLAIFDVLLKRKLQVKTFVSKGSKVASTAFVTSEVRLGMQSFNF